METKMDAGLQLRRVGRHRRGRSAVPSITRASEFGGGGQIGMVALRDVHTS
jgi:hypothetical protein